MKIQVNLTEYDSSWIVVITVDGKPDVMSYHSSLKIAAKWIAKEIQDRTK
jgi:hypothetical protein